MSPNDDDDEDDYDGESGDDDDYDFEDVSQQKDCANHLGMISDPDVYQRSLHDHHHDHHHHHDHPQHGKLCQQLPPGKVDPISPILMFANLMLALG